MPPRRSGNPAARATSKKPAAKKPGTYSLARYRAEAVAEPFRLDLDDGEVVEQPSGEQMMTFAEKYADATEDNPPPPREMLQDLLGEHYDVVMPIIGAENHRVMVAFMNDLSEHFGLGEAVASLG
jgi:hypothetical protein